LNRRGKRKVKGRKLERWEKVLKGKVKGRS